MLLFLSLWSCFFANEAGIISSAGISLNQEKNDFTVEVRLFQPSSNFAVASSHPDSTDSFISSQTSSAASAIGDDRLLKRAGRRISPESFTHGTSEQRAYWLRKGMETGNIEACDTFSVAAKN